MGYSVPTPIQREAIPFALDGRDIVGCAQTGTGKTAAFVLPLLQRLSSGDGSPRALVVTPTRELALQIEGVARAVANFTRHRVAAIYGGVGYGPQLQALRRGVDLLVGTPGRLLDLHGQGAMDLRSISALVLDEADRMLDMGFWPQVRRVIALLPRRRQNLLFSATMSPEVLRIIGSTLTDPAHVNVSPPAKPVEEVAQRVYPVSGRQKTDLLVRLIQQDRPLLVAEGGASGHHRIPSPRHRTRRHRADLGRSQEVALPSGGGAGQQREDGREEKQAFRERAHGWWRQPSAFGWTRGPRPLM